MSRPAKGPGSQALGRAQWIVMAQTADGRIGGIFTSEQIATTALDELRKQGFQPDMYAVLRPNWLWTFTRRRSVPTDAWMQTFTTPPN